MSRPTGIRKATWRQDTPQMQLVSLTGAILGWVMMIQEQQATNPKLTKALDEIEKYATECQELAAWESETWDGPTWQGRKL
jgi:hypothetical protein